VHDEQMQVLLACPHLTHTMTGAGIDAINGMKGNLQVSIVSDTNILVCMHQLMIAQFSSSFKHALLALLACLLCYL
jgi:hypothetical protein